MVKYDLDNCSDIGLIAKLTSKLISNMKDQRSKIIAERFKEIIGIEFNIEEESKRRFKRLIIENQGNEEIVYFNDGSIEGKRIVTFVRKDHPLVEGSESMQMKISYSYY